MVKIFLSFSDLLNEQLAGDLRNKSAGLIQKLENLLGPLPGSVKDAVLSTVRHALLENFTAQYIQIEYIGKAKFDSTPSTGSTYNVSK